jgi:putative flippase GtrA
MMIKRPHIPPRLQFILRYIVSGGAGALIQLGTDVIMVEVFGQHYQLGVALGFCLALIVTFYLQKYWTFQDPSRLHVARQFSSYIVIAALSFAGNIFLTEFFVDNFHLHYLIAHMLTIAIVVVGSFLLNTFVTFRHAHTRIRESV